MKSIIIVGCGGHSNSVIDTIELCKNWSIDGLVGTKEEYKVGGKSYPIIGEDKDLGLLRNKFENIFLAIGELGKCKKRKKLWETITNYKYNVPKIISPNAIVSKNAVIKKGTFIGNNVVINTNVKIGENCIINTSSIIEHDSIIDDHCHISTGVIVNGGVKINKGTFIGSGSIIREGIELPSETILSAGKRIMGWPFKGEK